MNIQDTKTVLKALVTSKTPVTPMLWARHGIGKSSAVTQLAKELNYDIYSIILSQKEAVDVAGMLYTFENKALGLSVTASHPPDWFAQALLKGNCVLFLDEFNMARREVMNAAFELVLDRRLNNLKLPDSVFIVCAGNPDDERYDVTPMSESLRDRLMHIKVTPDVDSWLAWAKTKNSGIHADVVKFIEVNPKAAYVVDALDTKFPVEIKHSFRSWERVGLVHALNIPYVLKTECIRGIVGQDLAIAFMQSYGTMNTPIDAIDVLQFNSQTQDKLKGFCDPKKMRVDLITQTIDNLVKFSRKNENEMLNKVHNVVSFIKALPDDCANRAIAELFELPGYSDAFLADSELSSKMQEIAEASVLKTA